MNAREKARRLVTFEALMSALKARGVELRAEVTDDVLALYLDAGSDRLAVDEGTVSLVKPQDTIRVRDEAALVAFVEANYPTEVTTTTVVRPAFRSALTGRMKPLGGQVYDPTTGEVVDWAEVVPAAAPSSIQVRPNAAAKELAADLIRTRLPELAAGESAS